MSRTEGFAVMDVSTSICDDPKFRRIQRQSPELVGTAFSVYVAVMAESWRAGKRVSVDDAWPSIIPYDARADEALREAGLLDRRGLPSAKAWRSWFEPAYKRRETMREKWRRANENRRDDSAPPPRGNRADTAAPVPSRTAPSDRTVRPDRSAPSDPPGSTTRVTDEIDLPPHLRIINGAADPKGKTA